MSWRTMFATARLDMRLRSWGSAMGLVRSVAAGAIRTLITPFGGKLQFVREDVPGLRGGDRRRVLARRSRASDATILGVVVAGPSSVATSIGPQRARLL